MVGLADYIESSCPVFNSEFLIDDGLALGLIHVFLLRDYGGLHLGNIFLGFCYKLFDLVIDPVPEHRQRLADFVIGF